MDPIVQHPVFPRTGQPLKQLNMIAKKPPVDIEFCDLNYSIADSRVKGGK